jgi:hypothetical protein
MAKLWPVLAILAAAVVVFVLMSGERESSDPELREDDPLTRELQKVPELLGSEGAGPRPKPRFGGRRPRKRAAEPHPLIRRSS